MASVFDFLPLLLAAISLHQANRPVSTAIQYHINYDQPACVNGYGSDGIAVDAVMPVEQLAAVKLWYPSVLDEQGRVCVVAYTDVQTATIYTSRWDALLHEFGHLLMYWSFPNSECADEILGYEWQWVGHGGPCDPLSYDQTKGDQ